MEFNFTILIQRVIELLAFYLILANIDGNSLKESVTRLFATKQKILYANMVLLVVYPIAITFVIQALPDYGYLIDLLFYPFVAFFLLRRRLSLKQLLVSMIFSFVTATVSAALTLAFSNNPVVAFLFTLVVVATICYLNYFEVFYAYLLKKKKILYAVCLVSFIFYIAPFFIGILPIGLLFLLLILWSVVTIYYKRDDRMELLAISKRLENARSNDLFEILQDISSDHKQSDVVHEYIIQNHNIEQITLSVSKKLDLHKRFGTIQDYECIISNRQVKVDIIV